MAYELFCQSVQGAGHIKKGMPCEDYGIKFENDECKIFALGDGHGDSNCPRSSFGSHSICEIAVQELQLFAKEIKNQKWEEQLLDKYCASELVNQLVTSIFGKWSCAVNDDFTQNPLSEKEESEAKDYIARYRRGERIEHIYGTTFIAGLMTDEYVLLLQQGDGRCVVFDCDGNATQPIPWDDRCFANVTTSVCDVDAVQSCRYYIIDLKKNPIIACVAGSDGVEDSFGSMDKMHTYYREKLQIACELGVEELEKHLSETLPGFSAEGSQDDITICGLIERDLFRTKLDKIIADNEAVIVNDAIAKAQERINSMTPKLNFLQKKCTDAESVCDQLKQKYRELEEEYRNIKADINSHAQSKSRMSLSARMIPFSPYSIKCLQKRLERIKEERDELSREIQNALNKKKICDGEYTAYKLKYDSFVQIKKEYEGKSKPISALNTSSTVEEQREVSCVCEISTENGIVRKKEDDSVDVNSINNEQPDSLAEADVPQEDTTDLIDDGEMVDSTIVVDENDGTSETKETIEPSVEHDVTIIGETAEKSSAVIADEREDANVDVNATEDYDSEVPPAEGNDDSNTASVDTQEMQQEKKTKNGFFGFMKNKPQAGA